MTLDDDKSYSAVLHTNHGDIAVDFAADSSPVTVNNFVFLAREGFYDGVVFHRVPPQREHHSPRQERRQHHAMGEPGLAARRPFENSQARRR